MSDRIRRFNGVDGRTAYAFTHIDAVVGWEGYSLTRILENLSLSTDKTVTNRNALDTILDNWKTQEGIVTDTSLSTTLSTYATQSWVEGKNYLTAHQSLDGYATQSWVTEAVTPLAELVFNREQRVTLSTPDNNTSLSAAMYNYYVFSSDITSLSVTLPVIDEATAIIGFVMFLTTASDFTGITFSTSVYLPTGFTFEAGKTYEINIIHNGSWVAAVSEFTLST